MKDGKVTSIVKLGRNITAEKLRTVEMETQIKAIHKTQAVIVFSPEGIILDANENFLNAMHYKMEEIKGKHHKMFMGDKVGDENGFSFLFIFFHSSFRPITASFGSNWLLASSKSASSSATERVERKFTFRFAPTVLLFICLNFWSRRCTVL
jgi:PAS domain-containing protein